MRQHVRFQTSSRLALKDGLSPGISRLGADLAGGVVVRQKGLNGGLREGESLGNPPQRLLFRLSGMDDALAKIEGEWFHAPKVAWYLLKSKML